MPKLDRYLFGEFTQSFLATMIVLLVVSLGGVLVDVLGEVADGKLPAGLLFSQLGLQSLKYLPVVLPLGLMLGLLLSMVRLYRDSEMHVLTATGVGPKRMLKPLLMLVLPVVAVIGLCSLWLGPWADRASQRMIHEANRSLIIAGLEAGRFTMMPNGRVIYVGGVSDDGAGLRRIFVQRQEQDRQEVVTAQSGGMFFQGEEKRYLRLEDGFLIEGPKEQGLNFRLVRFANNDLALPDTADSRRDDDPELMTTRALISDPRPEAVAQLHSRITPPLIALAFALLTLPLSRSAPRQTRYGRIMLAFLAYLAGTNLMFVGAQALADGRLPPALGLWWLSLPLLAFAVWLYLRDGKLSRPRSRT